MGGQDFLHLGPHVLLDQVLDARLDEPGGFHELDDIFSLISPSFPIGVGYAVSWVTGMSHSVIHGTLGGFLGINILQQ